MGEEMKELLEAAKEAAKCCSCDRIKRLNKAIDAVEPGYLAALNEY